MTCPDFVPSTIVCHILLATFNNRTLPVLLVPDFFIGNIQNQSTTSSSCSIKKSSSFLLAPFKTRALSVLLVPVFKRFYWQHSKPEHYQFSLFQCFFYWQHSKTRTLPVLLVLYIYFLKLATFKTVPRSLPVLLVPAFLLAIFETGAPCSRVFAGNLGRAD